MKKDRVSAKNLLSVGLASLVIIATAILSVVTVPQAVSAGKNCGDTTTFFDWGCNGDGEQITNVLTKILGWAAGGVTVAVVAGIIYGAIVYMTSGGNAANAKRGIGIIRNAVIALILFMGMYALLNFLIPGGIFT